MKKFIQKSLKDSNKGFSLVELIIVIAIMAILIGIVALNVIPYLEKSRESKDRQTIDSVYSAFQTAIADTQFSGEVTGTLTTDLSDSIEENLGITIDAAQGKLESASCDGGTFNFIKNNSTGEVSVSVTKDGATAKSQYGDNVEFKSSNIGTAAAASPSTSPETP